MSNEPTLIGTPVTAAGWHTVFDHASGLGTTLRVRLLQGPRASLGDAMVETAASLEIETLDPAVSAGTAWATIRVVYRTLVAGLVPLGEYKQPLYALAPMMDAVDIRAHPQLIAAQRFMPDIEKRVVAGDIAGIVATYAGNETALRFARFWIAGVTHFERPAFTLSVTRYYIDPPALAADYAALNKVYAWDNIRTGGNAIPASVTQPFWRNANNGQYAFEWRLVSVVPSIQRRAENVVAWQFVGRESWAKWLYSGGTWEPGGLA